MPGSAARMAWNADERLIARIASHFSGGNSSTGRHVLDAGIVDEDIDAAGFGLRVGHHLADGGGL